MDAPRIQLTRRRWDIYFIPAFVVVSIVSIPIALLTENHRLFFSPIGMLAIWLTVRQMTPTKGWNERTIRGTPGMSYMLSWLACCVVLGVMLLCADSIIFSRPFSARLEAYHIAATIVLVATMIGGVLFLDHRYRFSSRNRDGEP